MAGADRVERHVAAFNAAVTTGAWGSFAERFTEDAVLAFEGVPVGPFHGRAAIAAAYGAQPPTGTMSVADVTSTGDDDTVRFAWDAGGAGTMRLTWRGDEVAALEVAFDHA